jgi:hypothetical protein
VAEGREIKGHFIVEVDRDGYPYACTRCGLHFTFRDVMMRLKFCKRLEQRAGLSQAFRDQAEMLARPAPTPHVLGDCWCGRHHLP